MAIYRGPARNGLIVASNINELGPGKLLELKRTTALVEYFRSIAHREVIEVPRASLRHVDVHPQTRCYLHLENSDRWEIGRVAAAHDGQYEVHLPDRRSAFVSEAQLYVRCFGITDPTDTLVALGHETVFFHVMRARFVRSVLRQRAAYRGLTSLASSGIELYPHQVEIVRRVLEDPVQRYLLADEVGLGKTVEAGIIVRQLLLDEPRATVVIAVPDGLVGQWEGELEKRFDLADDARVRVCPVSQAVSIGQENPPSMLVVDEAHHLAALAYSGLAAEFNTFEAFAGLAHKTERLLLLSATPASTHQRQFLAMLHLLDPTTYRLSDSEAFRFRVDSRQAIGRLLLAFTEDADPFALKLNISQLRRTFSGDAPLSEMLDDLTSTLSGQAPSSGCVQLVRRIRSHVSETYRLHRRLLRSRRKGLEDALAPRADSASLGPVVIEVPDTRLPEVHSLIDDWRAYAAGIVQSMTERGEANADEAATATVSLLTLLLDCAVSSMTCLAQLARARMEGDQDTSTLPASLQADARLGLRAPSFDGEPELLRRLIAAAQRADGDDDTVKVLARYLRKIRGAAGARRPPRCVVFVPRLVSCADIAAKLARELGTRSVVAASAGVIATAVEHFRTDHDCFVLVCDRSSEEGLNLQFADNLILLDLPWSPNYLEQRIGRVDRIGRTRPVEVTVFVGLPNDASSLYEAWFHLLRDGFGVFRRSIAEFQFFVDAHLQRLLRRLLDEGGVGIRENIPLLNADLAKEESRIAEQSVLDEMEKHDDEAGRIFTEMDDLDAEGDKIQTDTEAWLCAALKFARHPSRAIPHVVAYEATRDTLVPRGMYRRLSGDLERKSTYRRTTAVTNPGVRLRRIGDPLIDALWQHVQWDDRGQAFAIWRYDNSRDSSNRGDWVGFKVQYIVETDLGPARKTLESHSLPRSAIRAVARRADSLFPPTLETLYYDALGNEVIDDVLLGILRRPTRRRADGGYDTNLTKNRLPCLASVVDPNAWEWICRTVRSRSEESLRAGTALKHRIERAAAECERRTTVVTAQLRARSAVGYGDTENDVNATRREAMLQAAIGQAILDGVRQPSVRVNAIGCVVISDRHPSVVASSESELDD